MRAASVLLWLFPCQELRQRGSALYSVAGSVSTPQERSSTAVAARVFPLRSRCRACPATCFSCFRRQVFAGSRCARPACSPVRAFSWSVVAASRAWSPCARQEVPELFLLKGCLTVPPEAFFFRACCQFRSHLGLCFFWSSSKQLLFLGHWIKGLSFSCSCLVFVVISRSYRKMFDKISVRL
jgi:hypothetical protein